MKCIINDHIVLSRPLEGPLAAHITSFAAWVSEQGYAPYSIYRRVLLSACFSRWLGQQGVKVRGVSSEQLAQYLRCRAQRRRICRGDAAALRHLIEFLRREGVIPAENRSVPQLTPAERCTQAYEQYLHEAHGLAEATVLNYVPFISDFLKGRFGDGPVMLSRLCARDVVGFVQRQAARLHMKRAKLMTSALRVRRQLG